MTPNAMTPNAMTSTQRRSRDDIHAMTPTQ